MLAVHGARASVVHNRELPLLVRIVLLVHHPDGIFLKSLLRAAEMELHYICTLIIAHRICVTTNGK